jgi:hypothetical protein
MTQAAFVSKPITQVPIAETPPKRTGRPSGSRTRADAPSKRNIEAQIGGMLMFANMIVMSIAPLRNDALDGAEIAALAKAIDAQAKASPRFRRYLDALLGAGAGAGLAGVVIMIATRRAARHGMVTAELDPLLGSLIAGSMGTAPSPTPPGASNGSTATPAPAGTL